MIKYARKDMEGLNLVLFLMRMIHKLACGVKDVRLQTL